MPFTEQGLPMRFGLIGRGWMVEWDHIPAMWQSDKIDRESQKAAVHAG